MTASPSVHITLTPPNLSDILASTQCRATIGAPVKRHLNGVSLVGRWWPAFRCSPVFCLKLETIALCSTEGVNQMDMLMKLSSSMKVLSTLRNNVTVL